MSTLWTSKEFMDLGEDPFVAAYIMRPGTNILYLPLKMPNIICEGVLPSLQNELESDQGSRYNCQFTRNLGNRGTC